MWRTLECHRPDLSDCPPAKRERGAPTLRIGDPGPISHRLFTGVTTDMCVQTRLREANDRGHTRLIVADATESRFPGFQRATPDMTDAQGGIVGWCAASAAALAAGPPA